MAVIAAPLTPIIEAAGMDEMTEAHFNTGIGIFGAVDTLAGRCIQGFALLSRAFNAPELADIFQCRFEMVCARFTFWVTDWGIETNRHSEDPKFCAYERLVASYLRAIYRITSDLDSVEASFPTLTKVHAFAAMDSLHRMFQIGSLSTAFGAFDREDPGPTVSAFSSERYKWAIQHDDFQKRLELLHTLVRDLEIFLPSPHSSDPAGGILASPSLASDDSGTLIRFSNSVEVTPLHAGLALLKSIGKKTQGGLGGIARIDESLLEERYRHKEEARFEGSYDGHPVFVEERSSTAPPHHPSWRILNARIENIILRLQDSKKPPELRTLPCLGIKLTDLGNEDRQTKKYSIVYQLPAARCLTLRHILSGSKGREHTKMMRACFPLGRRLGAAQALARAVMYLHVAEWLHKAIRSQNVLFCADSKESIGSSLPYLVGFEYSRPDGLGEQTEDIVDIEGYKYYRHPQAHVVPLADVQQPLGGAGRYSKVYDIYSLGVILVEIGLFRSAEAIVSSRGKDQTPADIKEILIKESIPNLKFTMGEKYADAACLCLDGFFDYFKTPMELSNAFLRHVVHPLESCSV